MSVLVTASQTYGEGPHGEAGVYVIFKVFNEEVWNQIICMNNRFPILFGCPVDGPDSSWTNLFPHLKVYTDDAEIQKVITGRTRDILYEDLNVKWNGKEYKSLHQLSLFMSCYHF